jgi:hypothetical protein
MPTVVVIHSFIQGNFYTMLTFVLLSLLSVILLLLWLHQTGKRNKQGRLRTAAFMRLIPSHARWSRWNTAPATLLACCSRPHGAIAVEKWISATQQQSMPPLDRDSAIAELAQRLQASRR